MKMSKSLFTGRTASRTKSQPSASAPQDAASLSFIFWLTLKQGSFVSSAGYVQ